MNDKATDGQRPEALATFAQTARHKGRKAEELGLTADDQTKPLPTDPKLKQAAATKVLREGVFHQDQGADEAIDRLPDRIEEGQKRASGV